MPMVRCRISHIAIAIAVAALCVFAQSPLAYADTADTAELNLLRTIQTVEGREGPFARDLIQPLFDLGLMYLDQGLCVEAIGALYQAVDVSRRLDGLLNPQQTEILKTLMGCYVALDWHLDFDRAQNYVLLVNETTYGKNSLGILPALEQAARRYEEAGRYLSARQLHERAIHMVQKIAGKSDLRLIDPLRGVARTCRLAYQFQATDEKLDYAGESALERAIDILRAHPEAEPRQRVDTYIDLGDWYQLVGATRDALQVYRLAWLEMTAADGPGTELLSTPRSVLYRPQIGVALRRPPRDPDSYQLYFAQLDFTVTREGRVVDMHLVESDAPEHLQYHVTESLKRTRFRPRFVDGEPVDTQLFHRQTLYVAK